MTRRKTAMKPVDDSPPLETPPTAEIAPPAAPAQELRSEPDHAAALAAARVALSAALPAPHMANAMVVPAHLLDILRAELKKLE
jgi:hypothetical protein